MNPHKKAEKERRLSLLKNATASAQQKLGNPEISDDAKKHLRGRLSRLTKEKNELEKELGLSEEKESVNEMPKKDKKKPTKKVK